MSTSSSSENYIMHNVTVNINYHTKMYINPFCPYLDSYPIRIPLFETKFMSPLRRSQYYIISLWPNQFSELSYLFGLICLSSII